MYTVKIKNLETDHTVTLRYKKRDEAMKQWDKVVEDAIGGRRYQLWDTSGDGARLMSEYTPMNKGWKNLL